MLKKTTWLFCLLLLFASCQSRIDRPENEALMLDPVKNPKLKITTAAFLGNSANIDYLKQHCEVLPAENRSARYLKDSSMVWLKNEEIMEVALYSDGDFLNYGLHIGMTRADFKARFRDLYAREQEPFVEVAEEVVSMGCCTSAEKVWRFEFEKGRLKRIFFE
jgi:hypothetical protein